MTLRHSDTQTLRHSDTQTLRHSDTQTLRHSAHSLIFLLAVQFVISGCGAIDAKIMFGSSKITDIGSVLPPSTDNPSNQNPPNQSPLGSFPVDLSTPFFADDFNRADELLTLNPKWTSFMGYSGFVTNQEVTTSTEGGAYLVPNNPAIFPDLAKVYVESSVTMESWGGVKDYAILPYSDLTNMTGIMGCVFEYSAGSLIISVGNYLIGSPTQIAILEKFPINSKAYMGCEVDQANGIITAYLNSNSIGKVEGLTIPSSANSTPFMFAQGDGIVIDDVKAFNSFSEGRAPNSDDLRIYNTPYATYYTDQLSNFFLQGYCANNGATVQVKDLAPNTYQSAAVICTNNSFGINLNLSDLTRFPIGANRLRVEYVSAGSTQEYFWDFVKSSSSIGPEPATIAYVTKWKTDNQIPNSVPGSQSTTDTQILLPLVSGGIYNFTVDWGDGSSDTITSWNDPKKLHTYSIAGEYIVSIIGTFTNFGTIPANDSTLSGDPWKLIDVLQWGNNKWFDMSYMFAGSGLTILSATGNPDTSLVKNMSGLFLHSVNFNSPVTFDTSNVIKMQQMFTAARSFNQPVNLNTSKVVDMSGMFNVADVFNQPINFDTGNVVNMNGMFSNAHSFNSPINFTDTSKVRDMSWMFNGTPFNQPLNFDTSSVTDMSMMFWGVSAFNQNLSNWIVNPNVTNCSNFSTNANPSWTQKPAFANCSP